MKNIHYTYSTAELASYYGLTPKGLAYYEKKDIIHPERLDDSHYRSFSLEDCYALYQSKFYSNCGYPLSEMAESIHHDDESEFCERIHRHVDAMKEQASRLIRMSECADWIAEVMKGAEKSTSYQIVTRPETVRLHVRTYRKEHVFDKIKSDEFEQWNSAIPINIASLQYSYGMLMVGDQADVDIGNIMLKKDFDHFGFAWNPDLNLLGEKQCMFTVLSVDSEAINQTEWLNPGLKWISDHGYFLDGDVITGLLAVINSGSKKMRYDGVWFPVRK